MCYEKYSLNMLICFSMNEQLKKLGNFKVVKVNGVANWMERGYSTIPD